MTKRVLAMVVVACSLLVAWGPAPGGASAAAPERSAPAQNAALPAFLPCAHINGNHPAHPVLGLGSQGRDVFELQCRIGIWAEGHSRGCCGYDGIFGSRTRQRVIDIQSWCRVYTGRTDIAVDGVAGPVTWRMMHAYSCWA